MNNTNKTDVPEVRTPSSPVLILVKHALPQIVPGMPANRWRLSEAGRQRCKPLAYQLAAHHPQVIYASQEAKASETAQLLAQSLSLPIFPHPDLHEHLRETAAFTCQDEFEAAVGRFFDRPAELVFGEETADGAHRRFSTAINTLLERHPDQNLVIVAHGTVISLFVSRACQVAPFPFWKRLSLPSFVVLSRPGLALLKIVDDIP